MDSSLTFTSSAISSGRGHLRLARADLFVMQMFLIPERTSFLLNVNQGAARERAAQGSRDGRRELQQTWVE
jgi:hypothetical protein